MLPKSSKKKKTLYYWLNIIFALLTILPVSGFVYLGIKYGFLHDTFILSLGKYPAACSVIVGNILC
jgi:hypothetical protein